MPIMKIFLEERLTLILNQLESQVKMWKEFHDKFLENQIRLENQEYGRANVQSSLFKNVEIIFW
ncbi:hypothetical protein CM15mP99_2870 [bacterium]|nr:MAG: hypothetical protein CM15mP99_2870 [bacterium]